MTAANIGDFARNTRLSGLDAVGAVLPVADRASGGPARTRRRGPAVGLCPFAA